MVSMEMEIKAAGKEVIAGGRRREEEKERRMTHLSLLLHGAIPNQALTPQLWMIAQLWYHIALPSKKTKKTKKTGVICHL